MTDARHDLTGLPALAAGVAKYFASQGVDAVVRFGWKEANKQINQSSDTRANRIVIQPGDPGGGAGELGDPTSPGKGYRNVYPPAAPGAQNVNDTQARPLADWNERATVFVWGVDRTAPDDEQAQYVACRALLQNFRRACAAFARGDISFGAIDWRVEGIERQFGRELMLAITYRSPLSDVAAELVHPAHHNTNRSFVTTG